jgi:hypothetical protein
MRIIFFKQPYGDIQDAWQQGARRTPGTQNRLGKATIMQAQLKSDPPLF